jgi:hypothetical protein
MAQKNKKYNPFLVGGLLAFGAFVFFKNRNTSTSVKAIGSINTKYFEITSDTTIDDLKKQYYRLAKIHHPDAGGTNEAFREMNDEYEKLQNIILNQGGFSSNEKTNEQNISEIYRDIINSIITIPGIVIELVGSWIWISGNTYPVKEQIKAAGFKFHSKKVMWFWYPGEYKKYNNIEMDMDDIRKTYGSETIKNRNTANQLNGINSLAKKLVKLQKLLIKREELNNDVTN